jgi:hypothetical protein
MGLVFSFWGGVGWVEIFYFGFGPVPYVFSSCSQKVPQVLKLFSKMFAITPQFYPICFAQSSTLMYINWKGRLRRESIFVSILQLGSKEVLLFRGVQCSQRIGDGPIEVGSLTKNLVFLKKRCEWPMNLLIWIILHYHLINTNIFAGGEWACS